MMLDGITSVAYMLVKICMSGVLLQNGLNNCLVDPGNSHFVGSKSMHILEVQVCLLEQAEVRLHICTLQQCSKNSQKYEVCRPWCFGRI